METLAAITGAFQLTSQCVQASVTIAKWIREVKTVDDRLRTFKSEVDALEHTYKGLENSLRSPQLRRAAKHAEAESGGHLWSQLSFTIKDCSETLVKVNSILDNINVSSRWGRAHKQLRESLYTEQLARYHDRIRVFNYTFMSSMQMISLTDQLSQKEVNNTNQEEIKQSLSDLRDLIETLSESVQQPRRRSSIGNSTLVADEQDDKVIFDNIASYTEMLQNFEKKATHNASTQSGNTIRQDDEATVRSGPWKGSEWGGMLDTVAISRTNTWVDDLPKGEVSSPRSPAGAIQARSRNVAPSVGDVKLKIKLALAHKYLETGNNNAEQKNFKGAEDNFRLVLNLLKTFDFGDALACQAPDVMIMLANAFLRQDKFDEAVAELKPLTDPIEKDKSLTDAPPLKQHPDRDQELTACHVLAEVYLGKTDWANAELYAERAFEGRMERLELEHRSTQASVQLLIDIFNASGEEAQANAYGTFLKAEQPKMARPLPPSVVPNEMIPFHTQPTIQLPFRDDSPKKHRKIFAFGRSPKADFGSSPPIIKEPRRQFSRTTLASDESGPSSHSTKSTTSPLTSPSDRDRQASFAPTVMSDTSSLYYTQDHGLPRRPSQLPARADDRELIASQFQAIRDLCREKKHKKAIDKALKLMELYDPDNAILLTRRDQVKTNIKEGGNLGLAATGRGFAPIHFFLSLKQEAKVEVELLVEMDADCTAIAQQAGFNSRNPFTAFDLAVSKGYSTTVSVMLEKSNPRIDVNTLRDHERFHPLLRASRQGYVTVLKVLLEHGAVLHPDDFPLTWCGNSLLHEAALQCDLAMVQFIMNLQNRHIAKDSGLGTVNQQDKWGKTPLMYAVDVNNVREPVKPEDKRSRRLQCVKLLLSQVGEAEAADDPAGPRTPPSDVDLFIKDKKGNDVFIFARRDNDEDLNTLLSGISRKSQLIDLY